MPKVGIDDLIAARGPEIVRKLLADAWRFDGRSCPEPVHLSEIENAALGRKRLAIDLMVSAVGESYLLPKTIGLRCTPIEPPTRKPKLRLVRPAEDGDSGANAGQACSHCNENGGNWQIEIQSPELLIELTKVPSRRLRERLAEYASARCTNAHVVEIKERQTVTCFLATPKAGHLRTVVSADGEQTVDEAGRPFREKLVYFLGTLDRPSRYYRGIGVAVPSPKTQEATAFLWHLRSIEADHESFRITAQLREAFRAFQAETGRAWQQLKALAMDVTTHITNIYGAHRVLSLIGKLLVYHSILQFRFDGERLKRGWLEMLEIGDTGQGKTQQVDRIRERTGLGEGVDGVSTTRTGLAYAYQKVNDSWFLLWGKYPLNDGRLLFVDEAQRLSPEDIDKVRKGRSDGKIVAAGIRSGEHPTRTRLIMTCNPRYQGVVDDQMFGIELIKETFQDEDVRRFDFAIISSSSDDKADINLRRASSDPAAQLITAETLAASIRWAWSRRPEHVVFSDDAVQATYEMARSLTEAYGDARDIPLVLESDIRHKVARIAVAIAALLHSTDESHERVVVTGEHVAAVGDFLISAYAHPNCSFDVYARLRRR